MCIAISGSEFSPDTCIIITKSVLINTLLVIIIHVSGENSLPEMAMHMSIDMTKFHCGHGQAGEV